MTGTLGDRLLHDVQPQCAISSNRLFDTDAQVLRRFAARLLRTGQLRR
jgi:hypothetical protein